MIFSVQEILFPPVQEEDISIFGEDLKWKEKNKRLSLTSFKSMYLLN